MEEECPVVIIPPTDETWQWSNELISFGAVTKAGNGITSSAQVTAALTSRWPDHQDWSISILLNSQFLVMFPSTSLRDDAVSGEWTIDSHGTTLGFIPWSPTLYSVGNSPIAGIWISLSGVPIHLWSITIFGTIVSDFGILLDIDPTSVDGSDYRCARLKINLLDGVELPETVTLTFLGYSYAIRVHSGRIFDYTEPKSTPIAYSDPTRGGHLPRNIRTGGRKRNRSSGRDIGLMCLFSQRPRQGNGWHRANPNW